MKFELTQIPKDADIDVVKAMFEGWVSSDLTFNKQTIENIIWNLVSGNVGLVEWVGYDVKRQMLSTALIASAVGHVQLTNIMETKPRGVYVTSTAAAPSCPKTMLELFL